jgi:hypothetical protein
MKIKFRNIGDQSNDTISGAHQGCDQGTGPNPYCGEKVNAERETKSAYTKTKGFL